MSRTFLAVLAAVLAACLLPGCSERRTDAAASAATAASAASNTLVVYLRGAEIQAETDAQRDTLRQALRDLQTLPAGELRTARYAGAHGQPAQRNLAQVLRGHLVPAAPQTLELEPLLTERETEAGRAALRETLARLDPPPAK